MFSQLLAWPDQLPSLPSQGERVDHQGIATLIRLQRFGEAEALLLAAPPAQVGGDPAAEPWLQLMIVLRFSQRRIHDVPSLIAQLGDGASPFARFAYTQYWLEVQDAGALSRCEAKEWWQGEAACLYLLIAHVAYELSKPGLGVARELIQRFPGQPCMEIVRFQARIEGLRGDCKRAADLLLEAAIRFPQHLGLQAETASMLIEARSRDRTIPFLREALQRHGEQPEFMESVSRVKLLKREPGQARRCRLQLQAAASVRALPFNPAGLVVGYEQTGHVDWMPYLHPSLAQQPVQVSAIQHNLCMYLASTEAPSAEAHVRGQVQRLMAVPEFAEHARSGLAPRSARSSDLQQPLKIAWLTGDLAHHPVSRFVLGFFKAAQGSFAHHHLLVDLKDHESESVADRFAGIQGLERLDVGALPPNQKLAAIREQQPHLAIDLSGWTDGNFVTGFMARMAPVQVNYLGYFASTGIPAMDAWLGDAQLFPSPMREWHQEQIVRLPRCFIAWQPPEPLPEARMAVADAPRGAGIRFGSFNHNRKLSDPTLRLWGRILAAIPDARLVLKAHQQGDEATQVLLRRRMHRQGLDPDRVIWLPIAPSPEEHLQQYAQMDVALDCFPNGGCTTTCEALWMGVPVITLTGSGYVSRMSTAVLHGAGLPQLCATSQEHYLQLALEQAANLAWLRHNRHHWRRQVQTNPLGDAADLMHHLEASFTSLYRNACSASLASAR